MDLLLSCVLGEMRARAMVCRSVEGVGMGLKFMQMAAHDRAKLNQLVTRPEAQTAKSADAPVSQQKPTTTTPPPVASEFEKALIETAQVARTGTYYQLLEVSPDAQTSDIKRKYYELAKTSIPTFIWISPREWDNSRSLRRKWRSPIRRCAMSLPQSLRREACLFRRAHFGRKKNEAQETVEYCALQGKEYIRAGNFVGAVTWLRKCVALNPDNSAYHTMLAAA